MAITDKTRKMLWGRSGNCCAICRQQLIVGTTQGDPEVIGEECHIISGSPMGPRHDPNFPTEDIDGYRNLILLCPTQHSIIDKDPQTYTTTKLRIIKQKHESWVEKTKSEATVTNEYAAAVDDQYLEFLIRHTSQWSLPHSSEVLELDRIFIGEVIKERIVKLMMSLEEAQRTQTPVYADDVLLERLLDGHFDAKERKSHILILGEPGCGKTTLMCRWANLLALRRYERGSGVFPLWLPFKDWAALTPIRTKPLPLNEAATALSGTVLPKDMELLLAERLLKDNTIVFLDGFDELFHEQRQMIKTIFASLSHTFPQARFVVTSRKAGYTGPPPNFREFEILAFSDSQITQLITNYFSESPDSVAGMQEQLSSSVRLSELARTPLFLTIMCMVFHEIGNLPQNETDLYDLCIKQLIEYIPADKGIVGLDRREIALPRPECPSSDEILSVLKALARDSFIKEKDPLPRHEALAAVRSALARLDSSRDPGAMLEFVATNTELIRKTQYFQSKVEGK